MTNRFINTLVDQMIRIVIMVMMTVIDMMITLIKILMMVMFG